MKKVARRGPGRPKTNLTIKVRVQGLHGTPTNWHLVGFFYGYAQAIGGERNWIDETRDSITHEFVFTKPSAAKTFKAMVSGSISVFDWVTFVPN